jgi:hypothetical protein
LGNRAVSKTLQIEPGFAQLAPILLCSCSQKGKYTEGFFEYQQAIGGIWQLANTLHISCYPGAMNLEIRTDVERSKLKYVPLILSPFGTHRWELATLSSSG